MIEKKLWEKLGFNVSRVGFGAWGIGGEKVGNTTPIDGEAAILSYLNNGGNIIDTAPTYGNSEKCIRNALKHYTGSDPVYLCTKTKNGETKDSIPYIRTSCEKSLSNLDVDCIDIFYLHMPPEEDDVVDEALSELEALKKEGKIRSIGVSIKGAAVTSDTSHLCKKYIDSGRIDVIELVYSVLRQSNIEAMKYARSKGVEIVARTVLESGFLTEKYGKGYRFDTTDHRSRWNRQVDTIAEYVKTLREKYTTETFNSVAAISLAFSLKEESVSCIVLGAKNRDQVEKNFELIQKGIMPNELYERLRRGFGPINDECNPIQ